MPYYTCPKCQSTYELRAGVTRCPACFEPIHFNELQKDDSLELKTPEDNEMVVPSFSQIEKEKPAEPTYKEVTFSPTNDYSGADEGSYILGVVLALFLSWIGLIIAGVIQKKKTFRGALITFFVCVALEVILIIVLYSTGFIQRLQESLIESVTSSLLL